MTCFYVAAWGPCVGPRRCWGRSTSGHHQGNGQRSAWPDTATLQWAILRQDLREHTSQHKHSLSPGHRFGQSGEWKYNKALQPQLYTPHPRPTTHTNPHLYTPHPRPTTHTNPHLYTPHPRPTTHTNPHLYTPHPRPTTHTNPHLYTPHPRPTTHTNPHLYTPHNPHQPTALHAPPTSHNPHQPTPVHAPPTPHNPHQPKPVHSDDAHTRHVVPGVNIVMHRFNICLVVVVVLLWCENT